jgi:hypothetical protein
MHITLRSHAAWNMLRPRDRLWRPVTDYKRLRSTGAGWRSGGLPVMRERRSDFDVTNQVQVSDSTAVNAAVLGILTRLYPGRDFTPFERALVDVVRLFRGEYPGYHGCETWYHDLQHTLDMTLALARLIDGYERSHAHDGRALGAERALVGLITALYHDAGYMRRVHDTRHGHGAEYTLTHVTRSGRFLAEYLPSLGLGHVIHITDQMVHFTGYEIHPENIHLEDRLYEKLGHLLGTADLIAQMADRCYLEKCRDRLYREFVLGGVARRRDPSGAEVVEYSSPQHLLQRTPDFCRKTRQDRLDGAFGGVYRYAGVHFGGRNLYIDQIERNLAHLQRVINEDDWALLRRKPPCFTAEALKPLRGLALAATLH